MNKKKRIKKIEKEYNKIWNDHVSRGATIDGVDGERISELWEEYKSLIGVNNVKQSNNNNGNKTD